MTIDHRNRLYIDGQWVSPAGSGTLDVINAATEEVMGRVPDGTAADVDRAVAAARGAFEEWAATDREERAKYLKRIGEGLQSRVMDIASVIAQEVGMPVNLAMVIQAGLPIMTFSSMGDVMAAFAFEEQLGSSLIVREPVGVVGAITPWNYPLHQVAAKVAPALAAGCTVVVKPSEVAPLSAFILAEVIDAAGLPPGVFNLVTGVGPVAGEALAAHPGVDMVSFTGSTRAGRRVSELASVSVKRVALELGGKSPNLLLDDADVARAVRDGVAKAFINSGQTCSALTRMIVPRARLAEVEQRAVEAAESYTPGDPMTPGTRLGPLASEAQRRRVRGYIQSGLDGGAKLLCGGLEPPAGLERGYFVRPTVFSDVDPASVIAQEEIFGPVLVRSSPTRPRTRRWRSPTAPCTAWPPACGRVMTTGPWRWPASCGPARSRSTAGSSTRSPPSAATSSRATAASSAGSGWRSSSRSSHSSFEPGSGRGGGIIGGGRRRGPRSRAGQPGRRTVAVHADVAVERLAVALQDQLGQPAVGSELRTRAHLDVGVAGGPLGRLRRDAVDQHPGEEEVGHDRDPGRAEPPAPVEGVGHRWRAPGRRTLARPTRRPGCPRAAGQPCTGRRWRRGRSNLG